MQDKYSTGSDPSIGSFNGSETVIKSVEYEEDASSHMVDSNMVCIVHNVPIAAKFCFIYFIVVQ